MLDTLYLKLSLKIEICIASLRQRCTGGAAPDSTTHIDRAVIATTTMRCTQIEALGLDFNDV